MKLPTYENDHYELDDGEAINFEHPNSFNIPDKILRENLNVNDLVKLIFRMEKTKGSDGLSVERMWVKVTKSFNGFYSGTLDNQPIDSDCVNVGQTVYFKPCHVIQIH